MRSESTATRLRAALISLEIVVVMILIVYLEGQVNAQQLQKHFRATQYAQVESCAAGFR